MNTLITKNTEVSKNSVVPSEKDTIAVLLALLESLSFEVMSPDVWWLAENSAQYTAKKYGVSQEVFDEVMTRFENVRKTKGKMNPMSSMF